MRLLEKKALRTLAWPIQLGLWCILLALVPRLTWAGTVLGDLAAQMQPGTWAQLPTIGFNSGALLETCGGSNIVEFADSATWDPISRQVLFYGASHGTCYGQKLIIYNDATNTWQTGPLYPGSCSGRDGCFEHAYNQNALNPLTGDFYYRPYGSLKIHKYTTNGTQQWSTPTSQVPNGSSQCCGAIEYFPEMNGLIWVNGAIKSVFRFVESSGQWVTLGTNLPMGDYDNVIEYNPVHKVILFGGGRGNDRILYKLNAQGTITRLQDAPLAIPGSVNGLLSVDPASGKYLAFQPGGRYYEYEITNDTWKLMSTTHPLTDAYGYFELAETAIPLYGVVMFVMHKPAGIYIYKHAATPNPVLIAAPTNLRLP